MCVRAVVQVCDKNQTQSKNEVANSKEAKIECYSERKEVKIQCYSEQSSGESANLRKAFGPKLNSQETSLETDLHL